MIPAVSSRCYLKSSGAGKIGGGGVSGGVIGRSGPTAELAGVRELASLSSPWYFGAVPQENATAYAHSWDTAFDPDGLGAPFGLRTAEKRNPKYFCDKKRPGGGGGCCNWSGPMWPFETAKAISAVRSAAATAADC